MTDTMPDTLPPADAVETTAEGRWRGVLVVEGSETGDGRYIERGALTWRDLPLTLMVMFRNPDGGDGHAAAEIAGRIDRIWRDGDDVWGEGIFDLATEHGREAMRLAGEKIMRGISVDLDATVVEFADVLPGASPASDDEEPEAEVEPGDEDDPLELLFAEPEFLIFTAGRIMGATITGFPAHPAAYIEVVEPALVASGGPEVRVWSPLGDRGALVASAGGPVAPPAAWFDPPTLDGPQPVRVTADGQVLGHVAEWGSCHIGFADRCVAVPTTSCAYGRFRTGQTLTVEGTLVSTGPLVLDTVHPSLRLAASDAQAFYADTGCAVADLAVYEDQFGIVVAGAVRPGATPEQVRALRGGDVSPDWRPVNGAGLECVAMLVVNNSGFKVDGLAASAGGPVRASVELGSGKVLAIVGSAGIRPRPSTLAEQVAELRAQVTSLRAERARRIAERIAERVV